jgi:4-hydroxythreonine-4-phosphate dehydrogenase
VRTKIAITCGDIAGVGPEIIHSWLNTCRDLEDICVIGPAAWLNTLPIESTQCVATPSGNLPMPGHPSESCAQVAFEALQIAAEGCLTEQWKAVVTAPISKGWMQKVGFVYPGHTEFFASAWGGAPTMAFVGERLKLILATWHIPLMSVGSVLRNNRILVERAIERAVVLARAYGILEPRVAVCGLNPHAGEGGILGTEERDFIDPILDDLRSFYPGVFPCLPADTVFHRTLQGEFDIVVAWYHDQGLIPLKTLEFDTAVNLTLGLPYIRTSPDHGTGFSIAGKGLASNVSFVNAVGVARRLIDVYR